MAGLCLNSLLITPAAPSLPRALLQAQEELGCCCSWEGSVGAQGEVAVKDGVKLPQQGEYCKGEATFLFFLALLEGSSGI